MWKIIDNILTNDQFADMPESPMSAPYPDMLWRIDTLYNNGFPFTKLMPGILGVNLQPVKRKYIHVYDIGTKQDEFNSNGLAILSPTKCTVTEELNGTYELYMIHPVDLQGKWKYLIEMNVIKAEGQLFRIYKKDSLMENDDSMSRIVYARHIFYDLNDRLLQDVRPEKKNGYNFIDWIMTHMHHDDLYGDYSFYEFEYASDITDTATSYFTATSPVAALIGEDNCMVNRLGGELYRNNFYFSINKNKENAKQNAFNIRYGVDLLKVRETVDYTDVCTNLIAYDNFNQRFGVSYVGTAGLHHHHITKQVNFNYDEPDYDQFCSDAQAYFGTVYVPRVTYEVKFAALKNDERYTEFSNLQSMNVGDSGIVHIQQLNIDSIQKVVKKEVNAITGETISIVLGNFKGSIVRADSFSQTISTNSGNAIDKQLAALQTALDQSIAKSLIYWDNLEEYTWDELEEFTWNMLEGNL